MGSDLMASLTNKLPKEIYLLLVRGEQPIYSDTDEAHAISRFESLQGTYGAGKVRCWKVSIENLGELVLKREHTSLVPRERGETNA